MKITHYFDYAAATPLDNDVFNSMKPFLTEQFHNPSSLYSEALVVRRNVDEARRRVSTLLEVKPQEIVFTGSCTEANNLIIHGVMKQYPSAKLLISSIEHDSVHEPAQLYNHELIAVNKDGIIDINDLRGKIDDETVLVSIILVSNEIGVIQNFTDIKKVIDEVKSKRTNGLPLYLHSDVAQAVNYISVKPHGLGVDFMTLNGAKIYGPKGVGCVFTSNNSTLQPLIHGGGQEHNLRSGTENVASIVGLSYALEVTIKQAKTESKRLTELRNLLIMGLEENGALLLGSRQNRISNSVSVLFKGYDNEELLYKLDDEGYSVAIGSACHAANGKKSRVLSAIGVSDEDAKSVLRITLGRFTTEESVRGLVKAIHDILAK